MNRGHSFESVKSNRPSRSVFDLSYGWMGTADMGILYPVMIKPMVPGDTFKLGVRSVIRMMPLVAPVLTDIKVYFHTFFVPYRLLWDDWEKFITGGEDGDFSTPIPRWSSPDTSVGGVWDCMGFPVGVSPTGAFPIAFPLYAYNMIYNEYYRDENVEDEVDLTSGVLRRRYWKKGYFESALPWQQRGTAPAIPLGTTSAVWSSSNFIQSASNYELGINTGGADGDFYLGTSSHGTTPVDKAVAALGNNSVDLSAGSIDVADLRLTVQLQRWMELNARAGVRYSEYLKGHYGQDIGDSTIQRPVYIGGAYSNVVVSEVLQQSETGTTPMGTMAGHGINADSGYIGKFTSREFGVVMTMMSIMPEASYQQGIDREWLYEDNYEFFNPAFVNLSEQAIKKVELMATAVESENNAIFGYQEQYGEMRYSNNKVTGKMRSGVPGSLDYWHLGRYFSSQPSLNSSFLQCNPDKRIFAVETEPGFICEIGNGIEAVRPLPLYATPGFIDH